MSARPTRTAESAAPCLWRARLTVPEPGVVHDGGGVLTVDGRVERVLADAAALGRASVGVRVVDLGDVALAPGLVDAHAHLELGALAGRLPRGGAFDAWVGALLAARADCTPDELAAGYRAGARALLASGTTLVGDVDGLATWPALGGREGPRRRVYRELLDARDAQRRAAALRTVAEPLPADGWLHEGLSPHAPFSVGDALLGEVARLAAARGAAVAMHWAETPEEVAWLDGAPAWFDRWFPREPGMRGLDALERHGLLGPRTALIHGNHPLPGEPARIAAAGATVVHCPGSHAWFARAPFDWSAFAAAGVELALGTDSAASNDALDMRRELALVRRAQPALDPRAVWRAATVGGARALALGDRAGRLAPGAWADLVAFELPADRPGDVFDWLTAAEPAVAGVWLAGRLPHDPEAAPATGHGARGRDPRDREG